MPAPTKSNPAMSPDGGSAQPAVPKTELQELQMKAGEVTDEVSFHLIITSLYTFFKFVNIYHTTSSVNNSIHNNLLYIKCL